MERPYYIVEINPIQDLLIICIGGGRHVGEQFPLLGKLFTKILCDVGETFGVGGVI